jgi:hypothetical protein
MDATACFTGKTRGSRRRTSPCVATCSWLPRRDIGAAWKPKLVQAHLGWQPPTAPTINLPETARAVICPSHIQPMSLPPMVDTIGGWFAHSSTSVATANSYSLNERCLRNAYAHVPSCFPSSASLCYFAPHVYRLNLIWVLYFAIINV